MPAPSQKRRAHTKSRRGCQQCKLRHRKCDEVHPRCGSCTRLLAECRYPMTAPRRSASPVVASTARSTPAEHPRRILASAESSRPSSALSTPRERLEVAPSSSSTALDLELMATLCFHDVEGHSRALDMPASFKRPLIQFATGKPYLMHELMAITALRLFADDPTRKELLTRASFHQAEALSLVQPHLQSINEDHALALLFFIALAAISGLAEPALTASFSEESFDPIEKTLHCFHLHRGVMIVTSPFWPTFRDTWAWPYLSSQAEAGSNLVPEPSDIPGYHQLRGLAFGLEDEEATDVCVEAIRHTLSFISLVQQQKDASLSRRLVASWPMCVGTQFLSLLSERKPVALVILAYYAVLLKLGTGLWWIGEWPATLVHHLDHCLGQRWSEFLEWPLSIVAR